MLNHRYPHSARPDVFHDPWQAENKKRKTGEGLAVQHVALKDDATRCHGNMIYLCFVFWEHMETNKKTQCESGFTS